MVWQWGLICCGWAEASPWDCGFKGCCLFGGLGACWVQFWVYDRFLCFAGGGVGVVGLRGFSLEGCIGVLW